MVHIDFRQEVGPDIPIVNNLDVENLELVRIPFRLETEKKRGVVTVANPVHVRNLGDPLLVAVLANLAGVSDLHEHVMILTYLVAVVYTCF